MAVKTLLFIKANPGTGYVLGQVITCKNTGSTWTVKETDQEDANAAGLRFNIVDIDITQTQIDDISFRSENPATYKVNDVTTPTSIATI